MPWELMTGIVEQISEELNSHEEAVFVLPNTPENRAIVAADKDVKVWYNDVMCFRGVLAGIEYEQGFLKCLLYNWAYYAMTTKDITDDYPSGTAADTILTDIGNAAGIVTVLRWGMCYDEAGSACQQYRWSLHRCGYGSLQGCGRTCGPGSRRRNNKKNRKYT